MILLFKKKYVRKMASITLLSMVIQFFTPSVSYALTGGPSSPEFSDFESVISTDMVNTFTGDFSYNLPIINVPGPSGSGYAMSLSYHQGMNPEEEASWVGFGWTLNPGSINRGKQGIPDDFNNVTKTTYNKVPPNYSINVNSTLSANFGGGFISGANLSLNGRTYNNYGAFTKYWGAGLDISNVGSLGVNFSNGEPTFSATVNPAAILGKVLKGGKKKSSNLKDKIGKFKKNLKAAKKTVKNSNKKISKTRGIDNNINIKKSLTSGIGNNVNLFGSGYGMFARGQFGQATTVSPYYGFTFRYSNKKILYATPIIGFHMVGQNSIGSFGFQGNVSSQGNIPVLDVNQQGYMYPLEGLDESQPVLSDYQVDKETIFNRRAKFLGTPYLNADNYNVNGERLSGGFRMFRKEVGHFYPTSATSFSKIYNGGPIYEASASLTPPSAGMNVGTTFLSGRSLTKLKGWPEKGSLTQSHNDVHYESSNNDDVFFRFDNDLGGKIQYTDRVDEIEGKVTAGQGVNFVPGTRQFDVSLAEAGLYDVNDGGDVNRSSFIEYNKVNNLVPLDAPTYKLHRRGIANNDQIEEFEVTNEEGVRYQYGLPVYSKNESNTQIKISNPPSDRYIAKSKFYMNDDLKPLVDPQDGSYSGQSQTNEYIVGDYVGQPYATRYLMTGIFTPDYVDRGNTGPSDEDYGGWTSFHYRKKYGKNNDEGNNEWYRWRLPYYGLRYSQGSISDERDNMASLSSGEKEVYYMKSIETKTHVAFFVTNKTTVNDFDDLAFMSNVSSFDKTKLQKYLNGSNENRKDGYSAKRPVQDGNDWVDELADRDKDIYNRANDIGDKGLERLEKIVLFSKSDLKTPLKTVNLEYDYSIWPGLPNSIDGSGKLTLKRVWTEYNGVFNTRISPYEFKYNYPTLSHYAQEVKDEYNDGTVNSVLGYVNQYSGSAKEQPPYQPYALDRWGYYQYNGDERFEKNQEWLYQGRYAEPFDPAAWQLKQIILPSGGEIHVQYEEKSYTKVQDKNAVAMTSLLAGSIDSYDAITNKYFLNVDDLGAGDYSGAEKAEFIQAQRALIEKVYLGKEDLTGISNQAWINKIKDARQEQNYIYFKYLYALKGANPSLDDCRSEYITGFVKVNEVGVDGAGKLYIRLGTEEDAGISSFLYDNEELKAIPKQVCYDYMLTKKAGTIEDNACDVFQPMEDLNDEIYDYYLSSSFGNNQDSDNGISPMGRRLQADGGRRDIMRDAIKELKGFDYDRPRLTDLKNDQGDYCIAIKPELSYLRVPMIHAKRGGGLRVKRVLFYDQGIESGDASLYGTEYIYETEDGFSSGIATNEPPTGREENALVTLVARYEQSLFSKLVAGRYKQEFTGPIGEPIMPPASVGHSRVITKSIYRNLGKDNTNVGGFTVNKYHTADEYPISEEFTYHTGENSELDGQKAVSYTDITQNRKRDWLPLPLGIININIKKEWAAQGYNFLLHNKHGQQKAMSTYAGVYEHAKPMEEYPLMNSVEYEYFEPGEKIKFLRKDGTYVEDTPGKQMDVAMEVKSVEETLSDFTLPFTIGLTIMPGTPILVAINIGIGFTYTYNNSILRTHLTSKVTNYPVIQKSVKTINEGVETTQENIAFNQATGQPMLTRTYDEYQKLELAKSNTGDDQIHDGAYYSMNIPAYWVYDKLAQKSVDIANTNELGLSTGNIVTYGSYGNPLDYYTDGNGTAEGATVDFSFFANTHNTYTSKTLGESVIRANAQTFAQFDTDNNGVTNNERFRVQSNYVFKTDRTNADNLLASNDNKIYNAGLYNNFTMFDYDGANPSWIKATEIKKYSPHGDALEEVNALEIPSAAKFEDVTRLPIMIAGNAEYSTICYRNFEETNTSFAHSGNGSELLTNLSTGVFTEDLEVTDRLIDHGGLIMVWVKSDMPEEGSLKYSVDGGTNNYSLMKVSRTGEWELFTAKVDFSTIPSGTLFNPLITTNSGGQVYLDDIRFQPFESEATCYVYDNQHRLITSFDDQHFGMYYEYNPEGKLIRKRIETERGFMTIQETQYNTPTTLK